MNAEKINFLQKEFPAILKGIPAGRTPLWGKMSLQQMVEHFSDSVRIASGRKLHADIITPEEQLPKMRDFMLSDKPFRENTPNPLMPQVPAPVTNPSLEKALTELQEELDHFFDHFRKHPYNTTRNPFFGDLNFDQNVHLLYKHAWHHLKQFDAAPVHP